MANNQEAFRSEQEKVARKAGRKEFGEQSQIDLEKRQQKQREKVKKYMQGMKDAGHIRHSKYLDE